MTEYILCQAVSDGKVHLVGTRNGVELLGEDEDMVYLRPWALCGREATWAQEVVFTQGICVGCVKRLHILSKKSMASLYVWPTSEAEAEANDNQE